MSINKYLPIDITFKELKYTVKTAHGEKTILNDIEGICKSGEMTAILGPSGAGKTSLLNGLCKRLTVNSKCKLEGKIQANNQDYTGKSFPDFAAYVMQDDILLETLTVKECIAFAADFKVEGTKEEKENKVTDVIKRLKLERCQNTLIGGHFLKGVSGGERKRTSIGFELVSDPQVIFLDEPTSGLDSFTAYVLIKELKQFAHSRKRTVIFTIHQPSSDVWAMFDRIILMVHGNIIYQGNGDREVLSYFTKNGFECPHLSNPGDYLLSIMHSESEKNVASLPVYIGDYQAQLKDGVHEEIANSLSSEIQKRSHMLSLFQQIPLILKRTAKVNFRNPILFKSRLMQSIIMALYIGAIWWQISDGKDDPTNVTLATNRSGLLYFLAVSVFMESVNPCVLTFPVDKAIFLREENAKLYGQIAYFTGKLIIDILTNLPLPILDSVISYFMTGLRIEVDTFFIFMAIMIIMSFTGVSVGYLVGTLFHDANTAMSMMPLFVVPFMLFSGFYKNRADYADWIGWIEYCSPFKYAFQALCLNEFKETHFVPNPIDKYNFEFSLGGAIGLMLVYFGVITVLAFVILTFSKKKLQ